MSAKNPTEHNNPSLSSLYASNDKFKLGNFVEFLTPEIKARLAKYADPLTLNFKLIIDYDKPYGLFADETNVDSALAYLFRTGQNIRYEMLKAWIINFQNFIKEYEFLLLGVEGLDLIQNAIPENIYTNEDKLSFAIRETSDMMFQSLLTNWRHIWYDNIRSVEVLPINLRRFDIKVLVFASGYYNMLFYDNTVGPDTDESLIFPTVRKLSAENFSDQSMKEFNHMLFDVYDCTINNEESGKPFTSNLMNEQNSDFIKNNLTLNFRFAGYSGLFNNISGNNNFATLLALNAANDQATKIGIAIKQQLKDQLKAAGKNVKESTVKTLQTKIGNINKMLTSKNSVIGDITSKLTADFAGQMVRNTITKGINTATDKLVNDPVSKINNLLFKNFGNNIYDIVANNTQQKSKNPVKLINQDNPQTVYNKVVNSSNIVTNADKGVKLGSENIYKGNKL